MSQFIGAKRTLQADYTLEQAPGKNVELERAILSAAQHLDDEAIQSNRLLTRGERPPRPKKIIESVRRIAESSWDYQRAGIYHNQIVA